MSNHHSKEQLQSTYYLGDSWDPGFHEYQWIESSKCLGIVAILAYIELKVWIGPGGGQVKNETCSL